MIYDIVLNYERVEDSYESYEWSKNDYFTYIEKIPIIRVSTKQLKEIYSSTIQLSKLLLKQIYRKTFSSIGVIPYCMLVTDMLRVLSISFNEEGISTMKSSLLLDEEEAIIEENREMVCRNISYKVLETNSSLFWGTRREKKIQKYLLKEIEKLSKNHLYDEIHYLYRELSSVPRKMEEEYFFLIEQVRNHFHPSCESLYEIIQFSHGTKKEP